MSAKKSSAPKTSEKYEQLGKMLTNIYESGYIDRNQLYKTSFLKGLVGGFGGVLGATILVALLLWFMSFFREIPLVGPVLNSVRESIQDNKQ